MRLTAVDPSVITDIRQRDYRRFLAIGRARPRYRPALYATTGLHLELSHISETVSEPMIAAIRYTWWREAIEAIAAGKPPRQHPLMLALADAMEKGVVKAETLLQMIAVRDRDLDPSLLAAEGEYLHYLDETAGALHRTWAHMMGHLASDEPITALSRGYSMIRLLLLLPYHAARGQVRFPRSIVEQHGLSYMASALAEPDDRIRMMTHYLHGKAMLSLRHAEPYVKQLPAPHRAILKLALRDAERLKQVAYDPYHPRLAETSPLGLVWCALRA